MRLYEFVFCSIANLYLILDKFLELSASVSPPFLAHNDRPSNSCWIILKKEFKKKLALEKLGAVL